MVRPNPRYGNGIVSSLSLQQLNDNINRIKQEIDLIYDPAWMMSPTDQNPVPVGWGGGEQGRRPILSTSGEFIGARAGTDPRGRPDNYFTVDSAITYLKYSLKYWNAVKAKYDYQCSQTEGARECKLAAQLGGGLLSELNNRVAALESVKQSISPKPFEFFPQASAQEEPITQESNQVNEILNDINNNIIQVPDWFRNNIEWVQTGHINDQQFLTAYNYLVEQQIAHAPITQEPVADEPVNESITDNMITQKIDHFTIENGRAIGQITFTATQNFNPFYYNKTIANIIQFKDRNGANILPTVKQNNLRFTETERDEIISYDESVSENTRITVESYVWSSATAPTSFSKMLMIDIKEGDLPKITTSGFMSAGVAGAIAGLVLLGFIVDSKVGK